ncbi:hypothetical protein DFJ77DRAFT_472825, partial [Powellomyces hirtus]
MSDSAQSDDHDHASHKSGCDRRRPSMPRLRSPIRTRSFSGHLPGPPRRLSTDELVPLAAENVDCEQEQQQQQQTPHPQRAGSKNGSKTTHVKHERMTDGDAEMREKMLKLQSGASAVVKVPLRLLQREQQQQQQQEQQQQECCSTGHNQKDFFLGPRSGSHTTFQTFSLNRPKPTSAVPVPTVVPTTSALPGAPTPSRALHKVISSTCEKHDPPEGIHPPGRTPRDVLCAWASTVPPSVDLASLYWKHETHLAAAASSRRYRYPGGSGAQQSSSANRSGNDPLDASAMLDCLVNQGYVVLEAENPEDQLSLLSSVVDNTIEPCAGADATTTTIAAQRPAAAYSEASGSSSTSMMPSTTPAAFPLAPDAIASEDAAKLDATALLYSSSPSYVWRTPSPMIRMHSQGPPMTFRPWTPCQGGLSAGESSQSLFDSMYIPRDPYPPTVPLAGSSSAAIPIGPLAHRLRLPFSSSYVVPF